MNRDEIISVAKGAGIAAAGAVLTYLTQWATNQDFGQASVVVAAVLSVLANLARKYTVSQVPAMKAYALRKLMESHQDGYPVPVDDGKAVDGITPRGGKDE